MRSQKDNAGDWQGLESASGAPRYAIIAEMLRTFQADLKVLDVGCGEAVLRSWLPKEADYTGIELSALALRKAMCCYSADFNICSIIVGLFPTSIVQRWFGLSWNEKIGRSWMTALCQYPAQRISGIFGWRDRRAAKLRRHRYQASF